MTCFRPCIDLHNGQVKQIVGGTLADGSEPRTNFVSNKGAEVFAELYKKDELAGGHIIQLGGGNEAAAVAALAAWPKGMQLGGGITAANARSWLDHGASKVIVTSYLFEGSAFSQNRLETLCKVVGQAELVIDLSCRRTTSGWQVATNRWQTVTSTPVNAETLQHLSHYCSEFLVHAADVEGLCQGIDHDLVQLLGRASPIACTYAGGANHISDLDRVSELSEGRVDLTFGSALDLFGGRGVKYEDCVRYNRQQQLPH